MKLSSSSSLLLATLAISSSSSSLAIPVGDGTSSDTVPDSANTRYNTGGRSVSSSTPAAEMEMADTRPLAHDKRDNPLCVILEAISPLLSLPGVEGIVSSISAELGCDSKVLVSESVQVPYTGQSSVLVYQDTPDDDSTDAPPSTMTEPSPPASAPMAPSPPNPFNVTNTPSPAPPAPPNTPVPPPVRRGLPAGLPNAPSPPPPAADLPADVPGQAIGTLPNSLPVPASPSSLPAAPVSVPAAPGLPGQASGAVGSLPGNPNSLPDVTGDSPVSVPVQKRDDEEGPIMNDDDCE